MSLKYHFNCLDLYSLYNRDPGSEIIPILRVSYCNPVWIASWSKGIWFCQLWCSVKGHGQQQLFSCSVSLDFCFLFFCYIYSMSERLSKIKSSMRWWSLDNEIWSFLRVVQKHTDCVDCFRVIRRGECNMSKGRQSHRVHPNLIPPAEMRNGTVNR